MTIDKNTISQLLLTSAACVMLAACASTHDNTGYASRNQVNDPFEGVNRAVFSFNKAIDDIIFNPTIKAYRTVVPGHARTGIRNAFRNLKSPMRFANQLLQGDIDGAGNELFRTVVNTLVGFGGVFDVAGYEGYEYEPEDFGQTLGVWGLPHGPYLVVPFLGPSSLRDYAGYAVDALADPLRITLHDHDKDDVAIARMGADYFLLREDLHDVLQDLETSSIDYYAAVRSTYYQSREAQINDQDGGQQNTPAIPDFDDETYDDE